MVGVHEPKMLQNHSKIDFFKNSWFPTMENHMIITCTKNDRHRTNSVGEQSKKLFHDFHDFLMIFETAFSPNLANPWRRTSRYRIFPKLAHLWRTAISCSDLRWTSDRVRWKALGVLYRFLYFLWPWVSIKYCFQPHQVGDFSKITFHIPTLEPWLLIMIWKCLNTSRNHQCHT